MEHYEEYDDLLADKKKKKTSRSALLDSLKEIEDVGYELEGFSKTENNTPSYMPVESSFCPSDLFGETRKKGKKGKKKSSTHHDPDAWFNDMVTAQADVHISKKAKFRGEMFDVLSGGKKKKKKKKDGSVDAVDYKKEFEPEVALLKNLLVDQTKFTDSLQKQYDVLTSHKSSSRGVNKQMSDLIENITSSRSLALQIVKELVNEKKLVSDLTLKQKKELGASAGEEGNISDFSNNFMRELLNSRGEIVGSGTGDGTIADYSDEDLFSEISSTLSLDENMMSRPEEIDKYLQYENRNVEIFVVVENDDYENYYFVAKDEDGVEIDDYPLPNKTSLSVNRSTMVATDKYGQKFHIINA